MCKVRSGKYFAIVSNSSRCETSVRLLIVDGACLINAKIPHKSKTFEEYVTKDIIPQLQRYSSTYQRTDIIFDVYRDSSLKAETRSNRGKALRRRVTAKSKTLTNWKSFLRDSANKTELFQFIADIVSTTNTKRPLIVTRAENIVTSANFACLDVEELDRCTQEEVDRILAFFYTCGMQ